MKIVLVFIVCFCALTASAGVCDTLGFKVNVPKISKMEDKVVGINISFDTCHKKIEREVQQRNLFFNHITSEDSQITIELPNQKPDNTTIQFYTISGQLIFQQQVNSESAFQKIQLPKMAAGIYQVVALDKQFQKKLAGKLVVL